MTRTDTSNGAHNRSAGLCHKPASAASPGPATRPKHYGEVRGHHEGKSLHELCTSDQRVARPIEDHVDMKIAVVDVSLRELVSGALGWQEVDPAEFDYATENDALERLW